MSDTLDLPGLRAFAEELADAADAITMRRFRRPLDVSTKSDGSAVTEADTAVEAALRDAITSAWPDHAILGEEQGGGPIEPDVPTWVIDPIDGTASYLRGQPIWGTLVGVVQGGRSVVGVASLPALSERWSAAAGHGATRNGQVAAVSAVRSLGDAQLLHGGLSWYRDEAWWHALGALSDDMWRTRGPGDLWGHLWVAGGLADACVDRYLSTWDVAALECIVTEAGGQMTLTDGTSVLPGGSTLTTNGALHHELVERLAALR